VNAEEPVGSAAEEAAKLLGAMADWARDHGSDLGAAFAGLAGQASDAARDIDEHLATGAEECRYCPICRAVQVYRAASPDVREHLRTAATSLAHAAAAMLATPTSGGRAAGVEHIDLSDDWPDPPGDPTDEDPEA
jgi:hypothetical protein